MQFNQNAKISALWIASWFESHGVLTVTMSSGCDVANYFESSFELALDELVRPTFLVLDGGLYCISIRSLDTCSKINWMALLIHCLKEHVNSGCTRLGCACLLLSQRSSANWKSVWESHDNFGESLS